MEGETPRGQTVAGFLVAALLTVGGVAAGSWLLGRALARPRAREGPSDLAGAMARVRPGLDRLKREVSSCLPLLNPDGKGNGQRFVMIAGEEPFDELQLVTTVEDPRTGERVTGSVRYFVRDTRDGTGRLVRDLWDPARGDWRGEPETLCEGVRGLRIRYLNDPRGSEYGAGTERRLFTITAPDGYDSRDASGRWTGVNPYLREGRLVIDSTDLENPDRGPLPSRLSVAVAAADPRTGAVVACPPVEIAIHTSQ